MFKFDLSQYQLIEKIAKGNQYDVFKVKNIKTDTFYAAKIFNGELNNSEEPNIESSFCNLNIILNLNYPSIMKYIGYSPTDFNHEPHPVFITEFCPNGSLNDVFDSFKNGAPISCWNETKKLINIFGIASGMSYLQSKEILYQPLIPKNIFIDENFYPKLSVFQIKPNQIEQKLDSNTSNDIYSFALIVYEILTNEKPFEDEQQNDSKPLIRNPIDDCYKELIEGCWTQNINERPTFTKIVSTILNDSRFISENVDKQEFLQYVDIIKQSQTETKPEEQESKHQNEPIFPNTENDHQSESIELQSDNANNESESKQQSESLLHNQNEGNNHQSESMKNQSEKSNKQSESKNQSESRNETESSKKCSESKNQSESRNESESSKKCSESKNQSESRNETESSKKCSESKNQSESRHESESSKKRTENSNLQQRITGQSFALLQPPDDDSSSPEDASAQFDHAFNFYEGKGVPVDKAKAAELFTKSANKGNARAQFNIGLMYSNGDGVEKDAQKAEEYLKKAADQQVPKALFCLGTLYLKGGNGVKKDKAKAAEYFEKVADKDVKAAFNLALMYLNGYGVEKDVKKACELFERAGEMKDKDAFFILGDIFDEGRGDLSVNKFKAFKYFSRAADNGNAKAQFKLGKMYHTGDGCVKDDKKARELLIKASEGGIAEAQQYLSQLPENPSAIFDNVISEQYDYEYNESGPLFEEEEDQDYYSNVLIFNTEKEEAIFGIYKFIEKRIIDMHKTLYGSYASLDTALADISDVFIDRKLTNVLSEFNQARDDLISAEDQAYDMISGRKKRRNRLPVLKRDDRGHISLDESNGLLSLSETGCSAVYNDDFDDDLYKIGLDVRTLEHKLMNIEKQIEHCSNPSPRRVIISPMSSSSETPRSSRASRISNNSFDRFFGNMEEKSDSLEDSQSSIIRPSPPVSPSNPSSPYQKRNKKFFE